MELAAPSYPKEAILKMKEMLEDQSNARLWLQQNHFPELILAAMAIDGHEAALHELKKLKQIDLTAFVLAVLDDKPAFNFLVENKKFTWAATVKVTYKDRNAEAWLRKNKLDHFAELGIAILKNEESTQAKDILGVGRDFVQYLVNSIRKK